MTRVEENGKIIESLAKTERDNVTTSNEMRAFQISAIVSMLIDISRSLAVIADNSGK